MAYFFGINIHSGNTTTEEVRRRTIEKWSQFGFLDHLWDNPQKENIARLLESEASQLLNETNREEVHGFESVQFPIVRRVYPRLLSSDTLPFRPEMLPDFWKKTDFLPVNKIKKHKL